MLNILRAIFTRRNWRIESWDDAGNTFIECDDIHGTVWDAIKAVFTQSRSLVETERWGRC